MTMEVVSLSMEIEVSEVARLLLEHRVSAVPVIDRDQHVLGIISEGDLICRAEGDRRRSWWLSSNSKSFSFLISGSYCFSILGGGLELMRGVMSTSHEHFP